MFNIEREHDEHNIHQNMSAITGHPKHNSCKSGTCVVFVRANKLNLEKYEQSVHNQTSYNINTKIKTGKLKRRTKDGQTDERTDRQTPVSRSHQNQGSIAALPKEGRDKRKITQRLFTPAPVHHSSADKHMLLDIRISAWEVEICARQPFQETPAHKAHFGPKL